jgi:hypothetical protein
MIAIMANIARLGFVLYNPTKSNKKNLFKNLKKWHLLRDFVKNCKQI